MVITDGLAAMGESIIVGIFYTGKNWRPEPIVQIPGCKRYRCESRINGSTKY